MFNIKRFFALLMISFILIFQLNYSVKSAQAFFGVDDAVEISILAGALVESGAVGDIEESAVGVAGYAGSLWQSAQSLYYSMAPDLMAGFQSAVTRATNGYFLLSACPGLSTYINQKLVAQDYATGGGVLAPLASSAVIPDGIPLLPAALPAHDANLGDYIIFYDAVRGNNVIVYYQNMSGPTVINEWWCQAKNIFVQNGYYPATMYDEINGVWTLRVWNGVVGSVIGTVNTMLYSTLDLYQDTAVTGGSLVLDFPATPFGGGMPHPANPITDSMPISIPANPVALSGATSATTYTNTAGVSGSVLGDTNTQSLGQAASDAANAAYKAAIAAGLTAAQAQAAAKAASSVIAAGGTAASAAAAGAAAATTAGTAAATGALTTDIATIKPGESINLKPLQIDATLFTNKFPFSLPWDLQRMITSFGTGSTTAPTFPIQLGSLHGTVDLSSWNNVAAAARIMELIIFNLGLVFGTRKLVGGDA